MMRIRARLFTALVVLTATVVLPAPITAHGPDPVVGGAVWAQDQNVRYRWRAGEAPPAAMQTAIKAAAADTGATRRSHAAVFTADPAGTSWINYGLNVACGVGGIACFNRANAPNSFTMSFREQGHVFDWGRLRWCQLSGFPDGCYDAENVALDEFGHVEILGHHDNFVDDRDYLDAVVQEISHTKPRVGWSAHAFGRCDVATLQRKYDVQGWLAKYSTCLDLATTLSISASATSVAYRGSVKFTAKLIVTDLAEYERLGNNPVSGRVVNIQRRLPGGAWTTLAKMTVAASAGSYTFTASSLTSTADWRAVFPKPSGEGLRGATSSFVTVHVSGCTVAPCPLSAEVP